MQAELGQQKDSQVSQSEPWHTSDEHVLGCIVVRHPRLTAPSVIAARFPRLVLSFAICSAFVGFVLETNL